MVLLLLLLLLLGSGGKSSLGIPVQTHQLCRHNLQPACQPIANLLEKRGLLHRVVQGHDEGLPVTVIKKSAEKSSLTQSLT